jgi:hypothetical protein
MSLGDFFSAAPHARPVNPKPITFTAVARGKILPGGTSNQHGTPVAATIKAAFAFMGGDGWAEARVDARKALRERFVDDKTKIPVVTDDEDFNVEFTYHLLIRVIREWDESHRTVGGRLFPDVDTLRELVELREANRLYRSYSAYVDQEHPEVVDDETFRGADGGSKRVAG